MITAAHESAIEWADERTKPPFLRRVRVQGYKSIGFCDVRLGPLTLLVGRNGSGKSNFLDALAFLRDALRFNVAEALRRRGGLPSILCRSAKSQALAIEIEAGYPSAGGEHVAKYRMAISAAEGGPPECVEERLSIKEQVSKREIGFDARQGRADWFGDGVSPYDGATTAYPRSDLCLSVLAQPPFLELADALRHVGIHNFHPEAIRRVQKPVPGYGLERDGGNLASVIAMLQEKAPGQLGRVKEYLSSISPDVQDFSPVRYGEYETIRFRLRSGLESAPLGLDAASMSDGTLRALAAIMAAYQVVFPQGHSSVIGIEEPETALHPAATRALVDALLEATEHTQILLTTHSGDLLSGREMSPLQLLVVRMRDGQTEIAPVDAASREILRKELYTLADLQRMNQLELDETDLARQAEAKPKGRME